MEDFYSIFNLINRNIVIHSNIIGKTKVGYDNKKGNLIVGIESLDRLSKINIIISGADILITDVDIMINKYALQEFKDKFDEFIKEIKL